VIDFLARASAYSLHNTCVGFDFVKMSKLAMVTNELLWQWIGGHLPGCGGGGGLGVRAAF
jgi:hypothetical protein